MDGIGPWWLSRLRVLGNGIPAFVVLVRDEEDILVTGRGPPVVAGIDIGRVDTSPMVRVGPY
ncbi:MAG: hypothetical protein KAJ35_05340, partial [Thermoplasmata archaeon]|nr:hypothetical protein [Thermoplasmata archaeon]